MPTWVPAIAIVICFNNVTLRWLNPLMKLGTKKELQIEDLYQPISDDKTEILGLKLLK